MSCLLHLFFFLLLLPLASTYGSGCSTECGNVLIRYPFGVGSDCSLEASFNISCNSSTTPPKPYLNISGENIEVLEISVDYPPYIRIKYPYLLYGVCYNASSGSETWSDGRDIQLSETQYTLSENNWLTATGCDDALTASMYKGQGDQTFRDGCIGICFGDHGSSGSCPKDSDGNSGGEGCCRSPIPKGASTLSAGITDLSKSWNSTRVFPCSYAFLREKGSSNGSGYSYNYSILEQNSTDFLNNDEMVVRLEWRVGNHNCSHTPRNSSFACKVNSDCVDFGSDVGGYLCKCPKGYVGNPYVGCQGHVGICVIFSIVQNHRKLLLQNYNSVFICKSLEDEGENYKKKWDEHVIDERYCIVCGADIDECKENPCAPHSNCQNLPGSFICTCSKGYNGDGMKNGTAGCTLLPPSNVIKIVLIGLGSALGLVVLVLLCLLLHKEFDKRKNKKRKEDLFKQLLLLQHQTSEGTFGNTKLFTAKELEKATDHFNESRICGRGGQGVVYKGMLSDGTIVAIKKLKEVDQNQVEQFINEVVILSQINHKNVVRLLGCCLATEGPQLVYEFLPNGTLFDFIHDPKTEFPLTWKMRLKIAADVAGALAYLHFASSIPIYHRDIKSTNILLDDKYVVKVSDFGISKLVQVDQTHFTTLVKGTFGYLDPEYYQTSQYTEKSDVYSFGVVLLELLTGQRPISLERTEMGRNLAAHFLAYMEVDNLDAILDTHVSEEAAKEEVIAVARLARRCLNVKGKFRPTMREVANELECLMISQIPSIVDDDPKEATISDIEYTWTISDHTSSTDAHFINVSEGV